MILLVVLGGSLVIALIRGGKISRFADLNLRWRGIILIGFLIQVLIFSNFWQGRIDTHALTPYIYLVSNGLLFIALVINYRLPGMPFLTLGLCLNLIAILFNGGYMPASPEALALAGHSSFTAGQISNNSIVMGPDTRLFFLGDIFAIPKGFIFPNVFSIGDILIAIGAVYLIQKTMVVSKPTLSAP
jgi:hypothetical protein